MSIRIDVVRDDGEITRLRGESGLAACMGPLGERVELSNPATVSMRCSSPAELAWNLATLMAAVRHSSPEAFDMAGPADGVLQLRSARVAAEAATAGRLMSRRKVVLPPGTVRANVGDGWIEVEGPDIPGAEESATFLHRGRQLSAIRGREMSRWHLSVAHRDRIPTWEELGFARDSLLPADVWLMVAHPPRKYWLNYNHRVLHLWEFRDPELIEHFRAEGEFAQLGGFGRPS